MSFFKRDIFAPSLPHNFGHKCLNAIAHELNQQILTRYGREQVVDLLGFSMGGLVSRIWMQEFGGASRVKLFISIATPHRGTILAQPIPSFLMPGLADMKKGSLLLNHLNNDISSLENIQCVSFYIPWDLTVVPGWQAKLPIGEARCLPALTHRGSILSTSSVKIITQRILEDYSN